MGVNKLLKRLAAISRVVRLTDLAGKTVGVCGHSWLHRYIAMYADEVLNERKFDSVVRGFVRRVLDLQHRFKLLPIVVFDGESPQGKSRTAAARAARRTAALIELEALEVNAEQRARLERLAVAIDRDLLRAVTNGLLEAGVHVLDAPYEADGQLAHLSRIGLVDLVLGNDSDFVVLGCRQVLYKPDWERGLAISIEHEDVFQYDGDGAFLELMRGRDINCNWILVCRSPESSPAARLRCSGRPSVSPVALPPSRLPARTRSGPPRPAACHWDQRPRSRIGPHPRATPSPARSTGPTRPSPQRSTHPCPTP